MTMPCLSAAQRHQRDALVLRHLALADRLGVAMARRFHPVVEKDDLMQVAREALLRAALRCRPGDPPAPYLRRCIQGALQHYLRDQARLVRVPRREHERRRRGFDHVSLDVAHRDGGSWLEQLPDPTTVDCGDNQQPGLPALEALLDQLPAVEAAALRLTLVDGLSLRVAAQELQVSATSVQRFQRRGVHNLRRQLSVA